MRGSVRDDGYVIVKLNNNGVRAIKYMHRLVAEAYVIKEDASYVVNHKDCNRSNNKASNLEWVSQQYNVEYSISKVFKVVNPEGKVFEGFNLDKFCRDNELNSSHMHQVVLGKKKYYKGWTAYVS